MSCKIKCIAYRNNMRDWEITTDGKLWPCCYYANSWVAPYDNSLATDKKLNDAFAKDPDWNNVFKNGIDNVAEHEMYTDYIWIPGWESETPPPLCIKECSVVIDEDGNEQSKAKIQVNSED